MKDEWKSTGDPTEVALQVFATKLKLGRPSLSKDAVEPEDSRLRPALGKIIEDGREKIKFSDDDEKQKERRFEMKSEFPFSSELKRMSTIYLDSEHPDQALVIIKGAVSFAISTQVICLHASQVERILNSSISYLPDPENEPRKTEPITPEIQDMVSKKAEELAIQGLRVISFGHRTIPISTVDGITREAAEKDFVFLGLVGIFDPPRPETLGAVRACKNAGIVVHMYVLLPFSPFTKFTSPPFLCRLTGDHVTTARAIAEAVEIISPDAPKSAVMTASEFDRLTDAEIDALPELPLVIARCAPETKGM